MFLVKEKMQRRQLPQLLKENLLSLVLLLQKLNRGLLPQLKQHSLLLVGLQGLV